MVPLSNCEAPRRQHHENTKAFRGMATFLQNLMLSILLPPILQNYLDVTQNHPISLLENLMETHPTE